MKFSPDVGAALNALTEVLDDPAIDIGHTLRELAETVRLAVPSSVGLSVRSGIDGSSIELTAGLGDPVDIGASLMFRLPLVGLPSTGTTIVLYATTKGAFVDLAADVAWLAGTRVTDITLDEHLSPPVYADPQATLRAMSSFDQAIGMLLGHGYLPEHAERHIDDRAAASGTSRHDAADLIIKELVATGPADEEVDHDFRQV